MSDPGQRETGQFATLSQEPPRIVAMDSQYCSMGRWISIIVGASTGLRLFEGRELCALAGEDWLTPAFLADFDERLGDRTVEELRGDEEFARVSAALSRAIVAAAETGPCIIHERAAAHVLRERTDILSVLVRCPDAVAKFPRAKFDPHFPELVDAPGAAVRERIAREDHVRAVYHDAVADSPWGAVESYDLTLNSARISREKCAEILIEAVAPVRLDGARVKRLIEEFTETWAS